MATGRTVISQLASVGEGALGKLAQNPVTKGAVEQAMQLKERVEKLVNGLADVEERVAKLEQRMDAIAPEPPAPAEEQPAAASDAAAK
jgi:hypothetical protein